MKIGINARWTKWNLRKGNWFLGIRRLNGLLKVRYLYKSKKLKIF